MIPPPAFQFGELMIRQRRINPTTLRGGVIGKVVGLKQVVG